MAGAAGSSYDNHKKRFIQAKFQELRQGDESYNFKREVSEPYKKGGKQYEGHMKFQSNRNVGKEGQQLMQDISEDPSEHGNMAIQLIMENRMIFAIEHLTKALHINPNCPKHYVNRSFCYLRLQEYILAEKDVQLAFKALDSYSKSGIKSLNAAMIRKQAYCILAQVYCGMKNYAAAEKALKHCITVDPENNYYLRELVRIRTLQLTEIGFSEPDVIHAISETATLADAAGLLTDKIVSGTQNYQNETSDFAFAEEDTFKSDDDDDESNPSTTVLISQTVIRMLEKKGKMA